MRPLPPAVALAAGAVLFALPFLQSGLDEGHGAAGHMDHEPHHGGSLVMLGNHHLEVVDAGGRVELYLSDASRRPERETFATVAFDDGAPRALEWAGYRLVAARPASYRQAEYRVGVAGEPPLTIRLPASGVSMPLPAVAGAVREEVVSPPWPSRRPASPKGGRGSRRGADGDHPARRASSRPRE